MPPTPSIQSQRPNAQPIAQTQNGTYVNYFYDQDQISLNGHSNQAEQGDAENGPGNGQIFIYENEQNVENEDAYY